MTIADKLNYLQGTKLAIKEALVDKGIEVSDTDTFRSYADKISSISSGSSGLSPAKMAGLCFWLDGQCNTRSGKDHAKTYFENLVWNRPRNLTFPEDEYLNNGTNNSWDGDFLVLGNWAHYPWTVYTEMTIESVFRIASGKSTNAYIMSTAYSGNFWLCGNSTDNTCHCGARDSATNSYKQLAITIEPEVTYYAVMTIGPGKISLKVNEEYTETTDFTSLKTSTNIATTMGTGCYTSHKANGENWDGLEIGMVRCWSRVLTSDEIQANYREAKTRFNF